MVTEMTLGELVQRLAEWRDEEVIVVRGTTLSSGASLIDGESFDWLSDTPEGFEYLLEVDLARDAVRVWSEWRDGRQPNTEDAIAAIVHYSANDAFLPL